MRDVPLQEDVHLYREFNEVQILATLRCLAINGLWLDGIWSTTKGNAASVHVIAGLLSLLGLREPAAGTPPGCLLIGHARLIPSAIM
jgi:hypothetical protein